MYLILPAKQKNLDSNNISIGIHYFKVLVQIHYSRSPLRLWSIFDTNTNFISGILLYVDKNTCLSKEIANFCGGNWNV